MLLRTFEKIAKNKKVKKVVMPLESDSENEKYSEAHSEAGEDVFDDELVASEYDILDQ